MRVAVDLVKSGEAHACVSAGNTGALMAISRFVLKTLPGIDRPAIATVLPNMRGGHTYVLDLGANVDCTAEHLLQFGIMGAMLVARGRAQGAADGRPAQHRRRGHQGQRGGEAGGASCCARAASTSTATSRATTSTRARPTWWCATASSATSRSRPPRAWRRCWPRTCARSSRATRSPGSPALVAMPVINAFRDRLDPRRYNGASLLGLARHRGQEPRLGRRLRLRPGARARGGGSAQRRAAAHRGAHGAAAAASAASAVQ